jgi:hypothetical protein
MNNTTQQLQPNFFKEINQRFNYYKIFLITTIVCILIFLPCVFYCDAELKAVTNISSLGISYFIIFVISQIVGFGIISFIITKSVFQLMLVHSIFNFLHKIKESKIHPTLAVWTPIIPFYSIIMYPLNFLKAYKLLNIKNNLPVKILFGVSILSTLNELPKFFLNVIPHEQKINIYWSIYLLLILVGILIEYIIFSTLKNEISKQKPLETE